MQTELAKQFSEERGATILEFVLVFPLLLVIVFGIVDVSLMLSTESILDEAVHRSVEQAVIMINLDLDVRHELSDSYSTRRLRLAREKVAQEGLGFLDRVRTIQTSLEEPDIQARAQLLPWNFTETTATANPEVTKVGLLVLRPGECGTLIRSSAVHCNRATLGTGTTAQAPIQAQKFLMERHPIKVIAAVEYQSYLPFLQGKILLAEAYAYRQAVPQGPFAAWEDPQLLDEGPPLATQPPERTPFPAPKMPEEEEFQCVVSWAKCLVEMQNSNVGAQLRPINEDVDGDGFCDCQ